MSLQQDQLTGSVPNPSHVLISYSFSRVSDPDLESDQVAISHSFNSVVWLMQSINIIVKHGRLLTWFLNAFVDFKSHVMTYISKPHV